MNMHFFNMMSGSKLTNELPVIVLGNAKLMLEEV